MRAIVTGAAGFIGSTLCDDLVRRGVDVVGIDSFTPYYDREAKERNLAMLRDDTRFQLVDADLADLDWAAYLDADVVYHLAAQAGVRMSWGADFATYTTRNVLVTQRLLEAVKRSSLPPRIVFASSSSVYGSAGARPSRETDATLPWSPYGVTKLTCEHLFRVYARSYGVPSVLLRLFTVYGPRQRPDMAIHRICRAAIERTPFPLYGNGSATRDFTFVDDVVKAFVLAAAADVEPATTLNIAGGSTTAMSDLLDLVGQVAGGPVSVERLAAQAGDVPATRGDTAAAQRVLGWRPLTQLADGIGAQVLWHRDPATARV